MEDDTPTIVLPGPDTETSTRLPRRGHRSALHLEEVGRARSMGLALGLITAITSVATPFMGGEPGPQLFTAVTTGIFSVYSFAVVLIVRDEQGWSRTLFRVWGALAVLASTACEYHYGVFSPTPLAVTLGISFFGRGNDRVGGLAICGAATMAYFVMAALMTADVLHDPGLFADADASLGAKLFMTAVVPLVLGATLFDGRTARATLHRAMKRASDASAQAEKRGAQLDEARQEIEALGTTKRAAGRHTGAIVGGWRLGPLIGRGAVGEVYAATHDEGTSGAVKVLYELLSDEPRTVSRFMQEGQIVSSLDSDNVVRVHDVGVSDEGAPYIAMELLRGRTLSEMLRAEGSLSTEEVVRLATDVGRGLDHAHTSGVIHRDIKPGNLFRADTKDGAVWKILDFGVSKLWHSEGTLTQQDVVGTPAYMSPEQATSKPVTTATDLYGLGAVLYRALTGRPPASGRTAVETLLQVIERRPVCPSDLSGKVSPDLEATLAIAMAVEPTRRFPNGAELARAFQSAAAARLPNSLRKRARQLLNTHPWRPLLE